MKVVGVEPDEAAGGLPADYWQACGLAEQGQYDAARRLYDQVDGAATETDVRLRGTQKVSATKFG